jgi:hypothetical protein
MNPGRFMLRTALMMIWTDDFQFVEGYQTARIVRYGEINTASVMTVGLESTAMSATLTRLVML